MLRTHLVCPSSRLYILKTIPFGFVLSFSWLRLIKMKDRVLTIGQSINNIENFLQNLCYPLAVMTSGIDMHQRCQVSPVTSITFQEVLTAGDGGDGSDVDNKHTPHIYTQVSSTLPQVAYVIYGLGLGY